MLIDALKLARARERENAEYERGLNRRAIERANSHKLEHIQVVGTRQNIITGQEGIIELNPSRWDFRKTKGVAPTPCFDPETGKRIR